MEMGVPGRNLAWWNVSHIIDYLLEWCPRKLSVDPKHCDDIREALGHWFRFLDARNLLSSDGHSVEILLDAVEVLRDDFIAAMAIEASLEWRSLSSHSAPMRVST